MGRSSHVTENSVTTLATTLQSCLKDACPLFASLMEQIWRHVLTVYWIEVFSYRPGSDSRTFVGVSISGTYHHRGDVSNHAQEFETPFAPVVLSRNRVKNLLGIECKISRHPSDKGVASITSIVKEATRVGKVQKVVDEDAAVFTVVGESKERMP